MTENADGTNKIIGPGENALLQLANVFGKIQGTLKSARLTRSCSKKVPIVSIKDYDTYM